MNTTTTKARRQVNRTAKLMYLGGRVPVLALTAGKETTFYRLENLLSEIGGKGFRLVKADRGEGEHEGYDILLAGEQSTCTCPGHTYNGHCRHVESLTALFNAGKELPPIPEAAEPEKPTYCPYCGWSMAEHIEGYCPI